MLTQQTLIHSNSNTVDIVWLSGSCTRCFSKQTNEWMKLEEIPPRNSKRSFLKSNQHALKTSHHHHHLSLNREGRWDTTDDFGTSFFHFSLFSTALLDLANSRPVHSLMLSSHLFLCLPCLHPPFTVPRKMVLARPDERETWPYHCSLRLIKSSLTVASLLSIDR